MGANWLLVFFTEDSSYSIINSQKSEQQGLLQVENSKKCKVLFGNNWHEGKM
jgi:sulfur relay (sulfurtransferase) DsrF/TusC family protein